MTTGECTIDTIDQKIRFGSFVALAMGGDRDAMEHLFRREKDRVYRFAYHLSRDEDQSDDIVTETFLRAMRSITTFRAATTFTTWLLSITYHVFLDQKKRRDSRREDYLNEDSVHMPKPERASEAHEAYIRKIAIDLDRIRILAEIDQLPRSHRIPARLYYVDLMPYADIAKLCGVPVGTIKSRLNRVRTRLFVRLSGSCIGID